MPYEVDGYTIRSSSILSHQKSIGLGVYGCTPPGFPNKYGELISADLVDDITYIRSTTNEFFFKVKKKVGVYFGIWPQIYQSSYEKLREHVLRKVVLKYPPDIIHVHSCPEMALAAKEAIGRTKIPLIYEIRGLWEESSVVEGLYDRTSLDYDQRKRSETEAMHESNHVICISQSLKNEMVERGVPENKISVVGNGVDLDRFKPKPRNMELASKLSIKNGHVIGYISSIRKIEGIDTLLEALPIILEHGHMVKALIVGDGPELESLKKASRKYDISNHVIFTGRVSHDVILDYYSLIDIFVVPRIDEKVCRVVTPLKPYEAMAMKKALIVSDLPALREIVQNKKTGLVFEAGNPADLADKILLLLRNPATLKRIGNEGREYVRLNNDWKFLARKYKSIYEGILANR